MTYKNLLLSFTLQILDTDMGYLKPMEELLLTNPKVSPEEIYKTECLKSTENFYNQEIRNINMSIVVP